MKDHFSAQADLYAKYRPVYPVALFNFILGYVQRRDQAWDCATGNGQTATALSPFFTKVMATDISEKQLRFAPPISNITYSVQPAEKTDFETDSFDLVTVSQALHWFNFDLFYPELFRVTRPGGWLAAWMYGGIRISPAIDALKKYFHDVTLGAYWDKERKLVDDHYRDIPFPLKETHCPFFEMSYAWTLAELEGYFNTWSALQKFMTANGYNPVPALMNELKKHWTGDKMTVSFPLYLRLGQVVK